MKFDEATGMNSRMICRLCHSSNTEVSRTIKSPYVDFDYTLYLCADCSSAFFDLDQHEVDLESIYAREASTKAPIYEQSFQPSRYWRSEVQTIQKIAVRPIESVLDVGCRTGDFLMHWPPSIQRIGVELSERSAQVARSRGLTIHRDYLEKVEFGRKFDTVTCYAVIEHLPNPMEFLATLSDLVNPGGILVILIPTRECLKRRLLDSFKKSWHMYSPPQHLNFLSEKLLDQTLSSSGFTLRCRRYSSGGMFNPLGAVPLAGRLFGRSMELLDSRSLLNRFPIFDHQYSYFAAASY